MEYLGLLVGLGNPGPQYAHTRHNRGFDLVDAILEAAQHDGRVESLNGAKFKGELWRCTLGGAPGWWLAAKPLTLMNLSGACVQPLLAWYKLTPASLLVMHDELDIPAGELRFTFGGGNAGHNGLKSITQCCGTSDFYRLRLGIGRPPHKGEVINWVLGRPDAADAQRMARTVPDALETLRIFARQGVQAASKYALGVKLPQEQSQSGETQC